MGDIPDLIIRLRSYGGDEHDLGKTILDLLLEAANELAHLGKVETAAWGMLGSLAQDGMHSGGSQSCDVCCAFDDLEAALEKGAGKCQP